MTMAPTRPAMPKPSSRPRRPRITRFTTCRTVPGKCRVRLGPRRSTLPLRYPAVEASFDAQILADLWRRMVDERLRSSSLGQGPLPLEIVADRLEDRRRHLAPVGLGLQQLLVPAVGEIAQLEHDRGHVGRLQHGKAGEAVGV